MHLKLNYLYRDGGHYKNHGDVVFSGDINELPENFEGELASLLESGEHFNARQIKLPTVFLSEVPSEDDHSFHEFESIELTADNSTDPRTPKMFLDEVRAAHAAGWEVDADRLDADTATESLPSKPANKI